MFTCSRLRRVLHLAKSALPLLLACSLPSLPSPVQCLSTLRASKPELLALTSTPREQCLLLIYNRESEQKLRPLLIKYQQEAERLGVGKVVLVDQTDVRHLQVFERMLRGGEDGQGQVDLGGRVRVVYVSAVLGGVFEMAEQESLAEQVQEIRDIVRANPSEEQLKRSMSTFNKSTILKRCYNQACIQEYKQHIRQLISMQLLRNKSANYQFYYTSSKSEAGRANNALSLPPGPQQLFIHRNDMLGTQVQSYSSYAQQPQSASIPGKYKFMMFIKPRVHIISKQATQSDMYWYVTCANLAGVPSFSINNTAPNMPVALLEEDGSRGVRWTKGHRQELDLLRMLRERYGRGLELLVVDTTAPSQLLRHVYQEERYCVFRLGAGLPYPKMLIRPPTLPMDLNLWDPIQRVQSHSSSQPWPLAPASSPSPWQRTLHKIGTFLARPHNYTPIRLYKQQQLQLTPQQLIDKLTGQSTQSTTKWILRVCGLRNSCVENVYEKYGVETGVPVYWLDGCTANVSVEEGDYEVEGGVVRGLSA